MVAQLQRGETQMGKDQDDKAGKGDDRPGKHDPEREGHVHEDTAKSIDPSQYRPPPDDDD